MGCGTGAALAAIVLFLLWMVGVCVAVVYSNSIVKYYPIFARVAAVESLFAPCSNHQSDPVSISYLLGQTNGTEAKGRRRHTIWGFGGPINSNRIKLVINS